MTESATKNELQQSSPPLSSPPLNLIYSSPGYSGPYPDFSNGHTQPRISGPGCAPIIKISPELVVKYGHHVKVAEAENILFIKRHAPDIPVPHVYADYTIGPYNRDLDDFGSLYDTYIIMTFVEGRRLDEAWDELQDSDKRSIAAQLRGYLQTIRSIPQQTEFIGSVTNGPLLETLIEQHPTRGPFANEQEFNEALVWIHELVLAKANLRLHIEGALAVNKHKIVLTHGDLQGRNIMVLGDRVTGIVDWETCGWYPEYWEFAKCFNVYGWPKDWPDFVLEFLQQPYWNEWAIYDIIKRHVW